MALVHVFMAVVAIQSLSPTTPPPQPAENDALVQDIVVVGTRLRKIKVSYAADRRILRWCHVDVSSGSKSVDKLACRIVGQCVKHGYADSDRALVCFHHVRDRIRAVAADYAARSHLPSSPPH